FRQSPNPAHVFAMFGVQDRTLSGKLISLLTVFASTLSVTLARDRSITATRRAYLAGSQDQIDVSQHIVDAVRVMLDAASVHHHRCFRAAVKACSFDNLVCGHTADLRGDVGRISRGQLESCLPVVRA